MKKRKCELGGRLLEYSAKILLQDLDQCVCLKDLDLEISGIHLNR